MTTIRKIKLNKGQIKAYSEKFKDEWYARLCKIDANNNELNKKHKKETVDSFVISVLRQDLPAAIYAGARDMIREGEARIADDRLREFIPDLHATIRRRINESSMAQNMRKAFENELMINPYLTQDEIYAFAETHWQLWLLRENLTEDWALVQEAQAAETSNSSI